MLHLHGFENHDSIARRDLITRRYGERHNHAVDRGRNEHVAFLRGSEVALLLSSLLLVAKRRHRRNDGGLICCRCK